MPLSVPHPLHLAPARPFDKCPISSLFVQLHYLQSLRPSGYAIAVYRNHEPQFALVCRSSIHWPCFRPSISLFPAFAWRPCEAIFFEAGWFIRGMMKLHRQYSVQKYVLKSENKRKKKAHARSTRRYAPILMHLPVWPMRQNRDKWHLAPIFQTGESDKELRSVSNVYWRLVGILAARSNHYFTSGTF